MITENRASHLSHLIRENLKNDDLVSCNDEMKLLQSIKEGVNNFIKTHNEVDKLARKQISSQKNSLPEGSMEWEVQYSRFYEQELKRKGY